jgi:hypothetical protein
MSFSKMGYVFPKGRGNTVWQPPYNVVPVTWQDWLDVESWNTSEAIRVEFNRLRIELTKGNYK